MSGCPGIFFNLSKNDVANYRNYQEAVGFKFRYFSTEMFKNGEIKLLAIDGVAPTVENIRNVTYPFIADCCIITIKPRSENVRKIVNFMPSPAGKELIAKQVMLQYCGNDFSLVANACGKRYIAEKLWI